jgi:RimJ/RimL family protein N-acetyltransferase
MGGVTILETERLILRPWEPEDAAFVLDLYSRWEVQQFIGTKPRVMTSMAEAGELIGRWRGIDHPVHAVWAVQLKAAVLPEPHQAGPLQAEPGQPTQARPKLAGTLLLKSIPASGSELPLQPSGDTEIGWHFHPDRWGKGFATEAAQVVLNYAFANGLPQVVAVTNPANTASQRLCTRIGLSHCGQTDKYYNARCELFGKSNPSS